MNDSDNKNSKNIEHLYKYRSLSGVQKEYVKKIFTDNELYFPSPAEFNDPFECRPNYSFDASPLKLKVYLRELYTRMRPEMGKQERNKQVGNILKNKKRKIPIVLESLKKLSKTMANDTGVFCMSEDPEHILMWSHYSDAHAGICLKFKADSYTPFFGETLPVNYQKEYPNINLVTADADNDAKLKLSILTKSNHWSYEKEWRIIKPEEGKTIKKFPEQLLVGVILGCKISKENKKRVVEWSLSRKYPPKIYTAKREKDSFGIKIHEIKKS